MFSGGEKTPPPRNSLPSCDSKQYQLQKGSRIEPGTNYKTRTTKVMLGGWKCLKWQAWTGKNSCVILKQVTVALEKGNGFIVSTDGAGFYNCSFHSILLHNSSLEWWKYPNCSHTLIAVIVKFHMPMKIRKNVHKPICSLSLFPWNDSQGCVGEPGSPCSFPRTSTARAGLLSSSHLWPSKGELRIRGPQS